MKLCVKSPAHLHNEINMYEGNRLMIAYLCNPPSLQRPNILHFTSPPPPPTLNPFTPSPSDASLVSLLAFILFAQRLFRFLPLPPLHRCICSAPFGARPRSTLPLSPISLSPLLWITTKTFFPRVIYHLTLSLCIISPSLAGENMSLHTRAH